MALIRDYGNKWSFLYVFLQNNHSLSLHISICLLLRHDCLTYHDGCFILYTKKYASMIRKGMPQITDQPTTDDNMQERQRKRWKETQNTDGNKTDQTPPDLTPHKTIEASIFIIKMKLNNRTTALKQPTPLGVGT